MRARTLAALAALALAVTACGGKPPVTSGTVTAKSHQPERHWTEQVPIYTTVCQPVGKTVMCHPQLIGFTDERHSTPECWRLALRDGKRTGAVCVDRQAYDGAEVGARYPGVK